MSGQDAVRETVQTLAKNAFASLPVEDMQVDRFCASGCWLNGFMARPHFSLQTPHPEHWASIGQDSAECFLGGLEKVKLKYPPNRIFNFDETCWKRYFCPHKA
jgi:hypothetical protein